ncbi:PilW family protein [Methylophaga pinxianii]|uniref:PilW family protein n=1 Tax=Methylophaga pinxianii TaxID=2881052 RepID=UPI001CF442C4|nr:PilW family protein [Methylophaga pinxianii]MCB2427776.1 PilW family protein [Methylophaga pinxianii]UPH45619.1 PilW family protein [Methylophaga pinxianii]
MYFHKKQQGLSLVELMVAVVLGLILVAGVIELFVNNRQVYRVQDAKARMQENGRYAMAILGQNIRDAGYYGCASRRAGAETNNVLNNSNLFIWDFATAVEGNDATGDSAWTPTKDDDISSDSGTDILTVRKTTGSSIKITAHPGGTPPGSANIQVNPGNGLANGDIIMATDCLTSAVFQVTSNNPDTSGSIAHNTGTGSPGNITQALGKNYTGGWVVPVVTLSYFISSNNIRNMPALYQRNAVSTATVELVEGIEDMQILYGIDTTGDGVVTTYEPADAVGNWNDVLSVKISLLLRSIEDNLTADGPQTYRFNDTNVTANDRRLRSVYTKTFTLRNRVS